MLQNSQSQEIERGKWKIICEKLALSDLINDNRLDFNVIQMIWSSVATAPVKSVLNAQVRMMSIFWLRQNSPFLTIEQLSHVLCLSTAHAVRKSSSCHDFEKQGTVGRPGLWSLGILIAQALNGKLQQWRGKWFSDNRPDWSGAMLEQTPGNEPSTLN